VGGGEAYAYQPEQLRKIEPSELDEAQWLNDRLKKDVAFRYLM